MKKEVFFFMLGVLGSDLSVICNYHAIRADVWVMKEYRVKESWMKMLAICLLSDIIEYHFCPFFRQIKAKFCLS